MSGQPNHVRDQDRAAFWRKVLSLPPELFSLVLDCCIGTPNLIAYEYESLPLICPRYETDAYPSGLPQRFEVEYNWLLRQKWLRSQKTFSEATSFAMTHIACLMCQPSRLPLVMQPCVRIELMGLEKVQLSLPTDVFFLLFKVSAPPFPSPDHFHYDETLIGSGAYLTHTRKLTLDFTSMNPWYNLGLGPWVEEDDGGMRPGDRATCTSGLVIDWILTYAWHYRYLQHILRVELRGDIQDWVKEKWYRVFAGTHPDQDNVASRQCIHRIEHHGEKEAITLGERWIPTKHYPPACRCELDCSRLRRGVVEPEMPSTEWEDDTQDGLRPLDTLPWHNQMETDW
ncbi:hypothetical protein PMIN06_001417 [Paraphaeosphaeria minitans]